MKRYYQLKEGKKGAYTLRENTYRRIRYLIADYPYFKKMLAEGAGKAELRETAFGYTLQGPSLQFVKYVEAIEKARQEIPEIYADDVMSHIIEGKRYKDMDGVSEKTIKRWVQRFVWQVARNLGDV